MLTELPGVKTLARTGQPSEPKTRLRIRSVGAKELDEAVEWFARERVLRWDQEHPGERAVDLARKSKVSKATISDIRRGDRGIGLKTAMGIAEALGVTWDRFQDLAREAFAAQRPAPREPTVERPARYPNLVAALEFLRDEVLPETRAEMLGVKLKSNDDLSRVEWVDEILATDRRLRRRAKLLPAEQAAEDARKEAQTDAAVERIRPPAADDDDP